MPRNRYREIPETLVCENCQQEWDAEDGPRCSICHTPGEPLVQRERVEHPFTPEGDLTEAPGFDMQPGAVNMIDPETLYIPPPGDPKPTNPKDAVGIKKTPFSCVPAGPIMEVGLGMMEGALKYGRHNYRDAGIRASVYYDAAMRHLTAWWEGEDIDDASGLSHITKAIASLVVLRDAMMNEMWTDDRPPKSKPGWLTALNQKAADLLEKYPNPKEAFTALAQGVAKIARN